MYVLSLYVHVNVHITVDSPIVVIFVSVVLVHISLEDRLLNLC